MPAGAPVAFAASCYTRSPSYLTFILPYLYRQRRYGRCGVSLFPTRNGRTGLSFEIGTKRTLELRQGLLEELVPRRPLLPVCHLTLLVDYLCRRVLKCRVHPDEEALNLAIGVRGGRE